MGFCYSFFSFLQGLGLKLIVFRYGFEFEKSTKLTAFASIRVSCWIGRMKSGERSKGP